MSNINNQDYLRDEQYKDASNLNARIRLHKKFSTNPYGWFRWIFDQYELLPKAQVLELGCGPGDLWLENMARIPEDWVITISDFSDGMIGKAQRRLSSQPHDFAFEVIDAQSIPYDVDYFDIVIANHFLYHVPDRAKAIAEIRRVLKPGCLLYSTTIGSSHMGELAELVSRFDKESSSYLSSQDIPFILENGAEQLHKSFLNVEQRRYPDELLVTDTDVLVDYAFSGMRLGLSENHRDDLTKFIAQEMAANDGVIHIKKDSGMFLAK